MILEIEIKNWSILEQVRLHLGPGLNVFTGETGAGKSLLLHALDFLLGGDSVGQGEVQAVFRPSKEACETLERDSFETANELYLSRQCKTGSRTVSRINGSLVPAAKIKALSPFLVEIHSQHSHHALLDPKAALPLIDLFGSREIVEKKNIVAALYAEWSSLQKEKKELEEIASDREKQIELCRYELEEIKAARLTENEEESLRAEQEKLTRTQHLQKTVEDSITLGQQVDLKKLLNGLEGLAPYDKKLESWIPKLREWSYEWEDFSEILRGLQENFLPNPPRLEAIIMRLDFIHRLQKKYGNTLGEILEHAKSRQEQLKKLLDIEACLNDLKKKTMECEAKLKAASEELSRSRKNHADTLKAAMEKELEPLALPNARFEILLEPLESWSASGKDQAQFQVSLNPGEPLHPLASIASGGELSRMMLALRSLLAPDYTPTLIFDEIDAGLGGEVAFHVALRLKNLAKKRQVLCVTHLHQVASAADHHFRLEKRVAGGKTTVEVKELNQEEKVLELARMMAGQRATDAVIQHAHELLSGAQKKTGPA